MYTSNDKESLKIFEQSGLVQTLVAMQLTRNSMGSEEGATAPDCIISCALAISHAISRELQVASCNATKYERALMSERAISKIPTKNGNASRSQIERSRFWAAFYTSPISRHLSKIIGCATAQRACTFQHYSHFLTIGEKKSSVAQLQLRTYCFTDSRTRKSLS